MANRPKATGTAAETAVVKLATAMGIPAVRVALAGNQDQGDVWLWPEGNGARVTVEVKSRKKAWTWTQVQQWWAETEAEAGRVADCDLCLLVVKRPGSGAASASDWFAWVDTDDLVVWGGLKNTVVPRFGPTVPGMWPLGSLLAWLAATK